MTERPDDEHDDGPCGRCDGYRWVEVSGQAYLERAFPGDPETDPRVAQLRRLYPTATYPCPACHRSLFLRWKNGCLRPGHMASDCDLCVEALGKTAAARFDRHAAPETVVR